MDVSLRTYDALQFEVAVTDILERIQGRTGSGFYFLRKATTCVYETSGEAGGVSMAYIFNLHFINEGTKRRRISFLFR